jgi:hypothetical protein
MSRLSVRAATAAFAGVAALIAIADPAAAGTGHENCSDIAVCADDVVNVGDVVVDAGQLADHLRIRLGD